MSFDMNMCI